MSSSQLQHVTVDRSEGVAVVRIDRPGANLLSTAVLDEVTQIATLLSEDPVGAVVLWGGPVIFSRGGDPAEFDHFDAAVGRRIAEAFHAATAAVAAIPSPTFAAIAGTASGGGLELALACDFRIAAAGAKLGQHEITLGLFPGGGGTQRLARLIGTSRAKELIFSGELVDAEDAMGIGLVNAVVTEESLLKVSLQRATRLATGSRSARASAKQAIDRGLELTLEEGLLLERNLFVETIENWSAQRSNG